MSVVLPKELAYQPSLASLPSETLNNSIIVTPSNGGSFNENSIIQFDIPASGFLDPATLYLRFNMNIIQATAIAYLKGTPGATPFFKLEVLFGSQVVESITNYNMLYNMICNLQMNIAQKVGSPNLGYFDPCVTATASATAPTFSNANGCDIPVTATPGKKYMFGIPLSCLLSGAEHLIPLFAMPNVRIQLTVDTLANMVINSTGASTVGLPGLLSNLELCYDCIQFGAGVEQMVRSMGDKVYIKSNSWSTMSQTLPTAVSGTNELIFNSRYASIRSLFTNFAGNTVAKCVNGNFDSVDLTSNNGDYQYYVAGVAYPQRPISTVQNKMGGLCELKMAINGGLHSLQAQNMSITPAEYGYTDASTATTATSPEMPGKYWLGVNCEKFSTAGALLTGISTQNSAVSLRMNIGTATTQAYNITLIVLYDALIEVDFLSRNASVKQ